MNSALTFPLVSWAGPWGLLLPALLCALGISAWLCRFFFPTAPFREKIAGGLVLSLAVFTLGLQLLLYLGLLWRGVVLSLLAAATLGAYLLARATPQRQKDPHGSARFWEASTLPALGVVVASLAILFLTAYWLPVWQWDSLGYHLPFVNFVLQGGGFRDLPPDVPYLSTYPRNVELLFAALRLVLPDDRLVDVGQIPLGLVGAVATAAIASEWGARRPDALLAGACWLLVPAVFLQLPTNYIDVGGAAYFLLASFFLLRPPNTLRLICAGLAIGMFLGTKPSVPPAAALLALVLVVRGSRAGAWKAAAIAVLASGLLGLEAYVEQLVRHGNPVWPAIVHIGPFTLPGTISVHELLSSGAGAPKVHGPLLIRVIRSWTSFDSMAVFDMRVGGLSPLFWLAAPVAAVRVYQRKSWWACALLAIAVVTPDPAVVRYILPLPALVLAFAASGLANFSKVPRSLTHVGVAIALAFNLHYVWPGLVGEGPQLFEYRHLSWAERETAVGANAPPIEMVTARRRLAPGEIAVYDKAFWLPYLMWRSDSANLVVRVPDGQSVREVRRLLSQPGVTLVAAGHDQPAARAIAEDAHAFTPLFDCREPCTVYSRP